MTLWLRRIVQSAAVAAVVMGAGVNASFAVEPGDFTNYLRGASQGLALGALPPPGIYGGFALDVTGAGASPGRGISRPRSPATRHRASARVLLFVPGWTIFGGSYAAQIVQGMYYGLSTSSVNPPFAASAMNGPELANTTFNPFTLSWTSGPRLVHRAWHQHHCSDRIAVAQHADRPQPQPGLLDLRSGLGAVLHRSQLVPVGQLSL